MPPVLLQILSQDSTQRLPAALSGLTAFVSNLRLLVEAQQAVATAGTMAGPHSSPEAQQPKHDVKEEEQGVTPMDEGGGPAHVQEEEFPKAVTGNNAT